MLTVIETPPFSKLWTEHSDAGDVVPGSGGVRKVSGAGPAQANRAACNVHPLRGQAVHAKVDKPAR